VEVKFFKQREIIGNEEQVSVIDTYNIGTSERGQSCNVLGENSQPISGNSGFVGEIERFETQWKTRDFT
jgi:hypothetical protein